MSSLVPTPLLIRLQARVLALCLLEARPAVQAVRCWRYQT